jgi:hypothetical protein
MYVAITINQTIKLVNQIITSLYILCCHKPIIKFCCGARIDGALGENTIKLKMVIYDTNRFLDLWPIARYLSFSTFLGEVRIFHPICRMFI